MYGLVVGQGVGGQLCFLIEPGRNGYRASEIRCLPGSDFRRPKPATSPTLNRKSTCDRRGFSDSTGALAQRAEGARKILRLALVEQAEAASQPPILA
jgi:hypothetical protein